MILYFCSRKSHGSLHWRKKLNCFVPPSSLLQNKTTREIIERTKSVCFVFTKNDSSLGFDNWCRWLAPTSLRGRNTVQRVFVQHPGKKWDVKRFASLLNKNSLTLTDLSLLILGRKLFGSRRKVMPRSCKNLFMPLRRASGVWAVVLTDGLPSKTITRSAR